MILDAAALLSFLDRDDPRHWEVVGEIELAAEFERLVVSPFVIAELEPLVRYRAGAESWLAAFEQLGGGAWTIAVVDPRHLAAMRAAVENGATLAAASVAVLAEDEE